MRKLCCILLLFCFLVSEVCLPEGDFSLLAQLPALYRNCKATEDPDMNWIDFITDHLINIDCIFDKHLPGDDQKPHQPFQFHNLQQVTYLVSFPQCNVAKPMLEINDVNRLRNSNFHSEYTAYIFHPPNNSFPA